VESGLAVAKHCGNTILRHYSIETVVGTPAASVPMQSALEKMRSIIFSKGADVSAATLPFGQHVRLC
jgi:hypothetical protein